MTPIDRARARWLALRRAEASRIIQARPCPFCGAPAGTRCQKNPPHGKAAPFPHVERRTP